MCVCLCEQACLMLRCQLLLQQMVSYACRARWHSTPRLLLFAMQTQCFGVRSAISAQL